MTMSLCSETLYHNRSGDLIKQWQWRVNYVADLIRKLYGVVVIPKPCYIHPERIDELIRIVLASTKNTGQVKMSINGLVTDLKLQPLLSDRKAFERTLVNLCHEISDKTNTEASVEFSKGYIEFKKVHRYLH